MTQANENTDTALIKRARAWEYWAWTVAGFGAAGIIFDELNFTAGALIASGLFAVASALCTRDQKS